MLVDDALVSDSLLLRFGTPLRGFRFTGRRLSALGVHPPTDRSNRETLAQLRQRLVNLCYLLAENQMTFELNGTFMSELNRYVYGHVRTRMPGLRLTVPGLPILWKKTLSSSVNGVFGKV